VGEFRDILVVDLLGGLGDVVLALPMIHALAVRSPGATLRVLTHEPGADLLRGDPAVTEVRTPAHAGPGAERAAVRAELARRRPDLAVSTTRYDGIPDLLAAAAGRAVTDLWRAPPPDELVDRRYLRILRAEGLIDPADVRPPEIALAPTERVAGERVLARLLPPVPHDPPIVLAAGAGMAVKRWPAAAWRQLAGRLRAAGHPLLSLADGADIPGVPALPRAGLRAVAAMLAAAGKRCGVLIGGDTGPVRVAAAVGVPVVGLFGPTLASRYGFGAGRCVHLQGLPDCGYRRPTAITEQTCWWTGQCPVHAGGPACLADIPVDAVLAAVKELTLDHQTRTA
jgi:ADP-heptose:LPS heptosyltransferase